MPSRTTRPSLNLDHELFSIWCRVPAPRGAAAGWYVPERAGQDMTHTGTIRDIVTGQVEDVVAVIAFNPAEGWSRDVTEDIAIEIADSWDIGEPLSPELRDFIETHAGLDYARGLRVADRTFAAA